MLKSCFLVNEAATIKAGQILAKNLERGRIVLLNGPLGIGKSTFARAVIRALPNLNGVAMVDEIVPSPTYTLVQTYERAVGTVGHFDLYRLNEPEEIWDLGLEDVLQDGVALIEWASRLGPLTPKHALTLTFKDQGQGRFLHVLET
ncbi:MAG: tRNA (adenosine(37)-N6)-threonylcarbamoyltransferase complex ATPase subunit type 1 TsaE [Alphaproteobacteria bacterium]